MSHRGWWVLLSHTCRLPGMSCPLGISMRMSMSHHTESISAWARARGHENLMPRLKMLSIWGYTGNSRPVVCMPSVGAAIVTSSNGTSKCRMSRKGRKKESPLQTLPGGGPGVPCGDAAGDAAHDPRQVPFMRCGRRNADVSSITIS